MESKSHLDNSVSRIQGFLSANAVLLPIPTKSKIPGFRGWQGLSSDQTQAPDFQICFVRKDASGDPKKQYIPYKQALQQEGNIGVLLGKPSDGLCSIDIDNDQDVEPFLQLNPKFNNTLTSKGRRGCNFWVKVEGEYPKTTKLKTYDDQDFGEWRADGGQTVISGIHPPVQVSVTEPGQADYPPI